MSRSARNICAIGAIIVLLLAPTGGCIHSRHRAVVADTAIAASLFSLQDVEQQQFQLGLITPAQHRDFNRALLPALKAGQSLNTALMAWKPGEQPPADLALIVRSVQQATDTVILLLPPESKEKLLPLVVAIQQSVLAVVLLTTGAQ